MEQFDDNTKEYKFSIGNYIDEDEIRDLFNISDEQSFDFDEFCEDRGYINYDGNWYEDEDSAEFARLMDKD